MAVKGEMPEQQDSIQAYYDAVAADYYKQYQRDNLSTSELYPANYFRLQILVNRLALSGAKRIYEVGVGEGTPLAAMAKMGFDVAGCDISEAMVQAARQRFSEAGLAPQRIQWADIEDSVTFANQLRDGPFDAVIAAGVLPHVKNDHLFLSNIRMLLADGGKAFVEFRNKLFSLFTFNRHTKDFILDDLLAGVDDRVKDMVAEELGRRVAADLPRLRLESREGQPGYDAIFAKFHNPFQLLEQFNAAGFANCRVHWYHYHPAMPMLEEKLGALFRQEALRLEHDPAGWRGYFLCSAGIVEADLAGKTQG